MNRTDLERLWNESLDARSAGPPVDPEAVAALDDACRSLDASYRWLGQNLGSWPAIPLASAGSLRRLEALRVPPGPLAARRSWRKIALAASMFVAAWLGSPTSGPDRGTPSDPRPPRLATAPRRPLGVALAEARQVSVALAREASSLATRLGRQAFPLDRWAAPGVPPALSPEDSGSPPRPLLQAVGDRLNAGVRPLPDSARHAFSFLLGPAPTPAAEDSL